MAGDTSRAMTLRLDLACFFRFLFFSLALFVRNRSLSAGESSRFFAAEGKGAATRGGGAERGRGEEETWLAAVERRKKLFQFFFSLFLLQREKWKKKRKRRPNEPSCAATPCLRLDRGAAAAAVLRKRERELEDERTHAVSEERRESLLLVRQEKSERFAFQVLSRPPPFCRRRKGTAFRSREPVKYLAEGTRRLSCVARGVEKRERDPRG